MIRIFTLLALFVSSSSVFASTYKCYEVGDGPVQQNREAFAVRIIETRELGGNRKYNHTYAVDVEIFRIAERNRLVKLHEFRTTSGDVADLYEIKAWANRNFVFSLYLNDPDQASMSLRGFKGSVPLHCDF